MAISIPEQYQSLKTKLETIVKKIISPNAIGENEDLNDYTEVGVYYCNLHPTGLETLLNAPNDVTSGGNGFCLFVENTNVYGNGVKQTLTTFAKSNTFVRNFWTDHDDNYRDTGWKPLYEDTGWTNITSFSSKFQNYYSNTEPLQFRRIGKIVHFRGLVKNKVEITNGGNDEVIFTIPSDFRPSAPIRLVMHGSYSYTFLLVLDTNGNALVERYGNGTTYTNLSSTGVWMNLYGTYFVD